MSREDVTQGRAYRVSTTLAASWAIVLAGGEGERLAPFVRQWLGTPRPKQYCRLVGERTMLEHTLARARAVVPDEHVVLVASRDHAEFLREIAEPGPGQVLLQPSARGTGPGVFLPLTAVRVADPNAVVHVLPSDHFVYPHNKFSRHLLLAEKISRANPNRVVLTAAVPDAPEPEFGWIQPGRAVHGHGWAALQMRQFHEKPDAATAQRYYTAGFLWNTMIVSATVAALWRLGTTLLPAMMKHFELLREQWHSPDRTRLIEELYRAMPEYDFSRDLLSRATGDCLLLSMRDIAWSDWGRLERVMSSIATHGLRANFVSDTATNSDLRQVS
jgi:mannose-1-phosphate guanylyltransferase